ncbi:MAG: hypothetical protein HYV27_24360 [Candidatus Hydrogenedentes bacterium]|nr:hypothetical protein [Candidatus Hydrogenedentota bacterium]
MILGLSCSHNATACLIDDHSGEVKYCASEERFTRRKQEWGFPDNSLRYALSHVAPAHHISAVAVGETSNQRFATAAFAEFLNLAPYAERDALLRRKSALLSIFLGEAAGRLSGRSHDLRALLAQKLRGLGIDASIRYFDHHHAHAAAAYYGSPFPRALVITLDGEGDGNMGSIWHGQDSTLICRKRFPARQSLGLFYKMITALLGYRVNRDEGKVMALAMRGDSNRYYAELASFLKMRSSGGQCTVYSPAAALLVDGWSRHNLSLLRAFGHLGRTWRAQSWESLWNAILQHEAEILFAPVGLPPRAQRDWTWQTGIAAAAQRLITECTVTILSEALSQDPESAVAAAGGLFANVCVNRSILESFPGISLYVHPGMGDEGLAFGAAAQCFADCQTEAAFRPVMPHVYLGPPPTQHLHDPLPRGDHTWTAASEDDLAAVVARAIAAGRVAGICRGNMEYGPRALGNRSILAHPGLAQLPAALNKRLGRSVFMPFAPAVLDCCMDEIFDAAYLDEARLATKYMTLAIPVAPAWRERLAAVVHDDGTARPQRLDAESNSFLHKLITCFLKETGLGCVLNTSFNRHGEPIVRTAEEAYMAWQARAVDILVVGQTCYARESMEPFGARSTTATMVRCPA